MYKEHILLTSLLIVSEILYKVILANIQMGITGETRVFKLSDHAPTIYELR